MSVLGAATTHARLGETTSAYANLFRFGAIEGVYCFGVDESQASYIVAPLFERLVLNTLTEYLRVTEKLRVQLPLFASLSFCNMFGCRMRDAREGLSFYQSEKYREGDIMPTEVIIEDYTADLSEKLNDTFTLIWNAFNFHRYY